MNISQIEINLQKLIATINKETFIFDLLIAYGLPKASITRLQKGNLVITSYSIHYTKLYEIVTLLKKEDKKKLMHDIDLAPVWIKNIMQLAIEQE